MTRKRNARQKKLDDALLRNKVDTKKIIKPKDKICMATVTKIDSVITFDDGTTVNLSSSPSTPPVAPTDSEVDVLLSDGTTKKFVPAP